LDNLRPKHTEITFLKSSKLDTISTKRERIQLLKERETEFNFFLVYFLKNDYNFWKAKSGFSKENSIKPGHYIELKELR